MNSLSALKPVYTSKNVSQRLFSGTVRRMTAKMALDKYGIRTDFQHCNFQEKPELLEELRKACEQLSIF